MKKEKNNEYNSIENNISTHEQEKVEEKQNVNEINKYDEFANAEEDTKIITTPKSRFQSIIKVAMISVAFALALIILPQLSKEKPIITNDNYSLGGTYYSITFDVDNPDNVDLYMEISNGSYSLKKEVSNGYNHLSATNLDLNTSYVFKVYGSIGFGNQTFYKQDFLTSKEDNLFKENVYVNVFSKELNTGYYFNIKIKDDLQYYYDYIAYVKDVNDNIITMILIEDVDENYDINAEISILHNTTLEIYASSFNPNDLDLGDSKVLVCQTHLE